MLLFKVFAMCFWIWVTVPVLSASHLNGKNLAINKPAKVSYTYCDPITFIIFNASRAVDGDRDQNRQKCAGSLWMWHLSTWWAVDLGGLYNITRVVIWFEEYAHARSFTVDVIAPANIKLCGRNVSSSWATFEEGIVSNCYRRTRAHWNHVDDTCTEYTVGQYIKIEIEKTDYFDELPVPLFVCEVEIYGDEFPVITDAYNQPDTPEYKCGTSGFRYNGILLRKMRTRSVIECTFICSLDPECYAANYRENTCELVRKPLDNFLKYWISDATWSVFFAQ